MTYLVLARKWRPRSFDTLIGQDHVVKALTHALETQRLHHAWLFTGTRGVGKTTLARILAKSLNCETGITANPCGVCRACTEIDAGRFVDYVELDAASNRGVEEMSQLLEQAIYAPSSGRYKVYMIDEVHMLTGHAFNAMLKTLEEPPAHVKFILATTDPQKIPVTVLSRCLQFNLKQMTVPAIVDHLQHLLEQEQMPTETPALRLLAQAADGSMRDALSLTDQAIAYSSGNISTAAVQAMLGTIDQSHLAQLLRALLNYDAQGIVQIADDLALRGLSFSGALSDLAVLLSRIAIEQRIPGAISDDDALAAPVRDMAGLLSADHVQLFYSVAVHSRQELSLAPDEYAGFVMACLRMLALLPEPITPPPAGPDGSRTEQSAAPEGPADVPSPPLETITPVAPAPDAQAKAEQHSEPEPSVGVPAWEEQPEPRFVSAPKATEPVAEPTQYSHAPDEPQLEREPEPAPVQAKTEPASQVSTDQVADPASDQVPDWHQIPADDDFENYQPNPAFLEDAEDEGEPVAAPAALMPDNVPIADMVGGAQALARATPSVAGSKRPKLENMRYEQWPEVADALPLSGWAAELARQSEWLSGTQNEVRLRVQIKSADDSQARVRLRTVLSEYFGQAVQLSIEYGSTGDGTAYAVEQAQLAERQRQAEEQAPHNPLVLALIQRFDGQLKPGSVKASPIVRAA